MKALIRQDASYRRITLTRNNGMLGITPTQVLIIGAVMMFGSIFLAIGAMIMVGRFSVWCIEAYERKKAVAEPEASPGDEEDVDGKYQPLFDAVSAELASLGEGYRLGWSIGTSTGQLAVPQGADGDLQDGRGVTVDEDGGMTVWRTKMRHPISDIASIRDIYSRFPPAIEYETIATVPGSDLGLPRTPRIIAQALIRAGVTR